MEYSVFIIQDRTKTNQELYENLASDVGFGDHLKNMGTAAVADAVGANILDRYATNEMVGKNGVVIDGEMIDSVSIKAELFKKNMFEGNTNRFDSAILRTITVKGSLFAPSLIEMKSETVKNKDMSRVMAWASLAPTPTKGGEDYVVKAGDIEKSKGVQLNTRIQTEWIPDYSKYYHRRVLVTAYSNTDSQFRAVLYDKVFVSSYEEVYDDKDGNGKFTLVMQSVAANVFDVFVAGPTYNLSVIGVTDEISSLAQRHTKTVDTATETIDKVTGKNNADNVKDITGKINSVLETADSARDGITIDSTIDNVNKQKDTFSSDDVQDAIDQATEYKEAYGKLTDDQKETLKNIPGFDKMSQEDKLKYIDKLTSEK